jgi:hypothetical protein
MVSTFMVPKDKLVLGNFADTTGGILDAMDGGVCKHAVANFDMFKYVIAMESKHCDKGAIGGSVISPKHIAFPVRSDLEPIISALSLLETSAYAANLAASEKSLGLSCSPLLEDVNGENGDSGDSQSSVPVYRIKHLSSELLVVGPDLYKLNAVDP